MICVQMSAPDSHGTGEEHLVRELVLRRMEDAIAVDALLPDRKAPAFALPEGGLHSCIVVPRRAFDLDLLRSFPHRDTGRAVRAQVMRDAPRCKLEVEGERVRSRVPAALCDDVRKLALCTQAVVGLPVELLHRSVGIVMEPPRAPGVRDAKLSIKVARDGEFSARKRLVVYSDGTHTPIVLCVVGRADDVSMYVIADRT